MFYKIHEFLQRSNSVAMNVVTDIGFRVDDVDETAEYYDTVEHIPLVAEIVLQRNTIFEAIS